MHWLIFNVWSEPSVSRVLKVAIAELIIDGITESKVDEVAESREKGVAHGQNLWYKEKAEHVEVFPPVL